MNRLCSPITNCRIAVNNTYLIKKLEKICIYLNQIIIVNHVKKLLVVLFKTFITKAMPRTRSSDSNFVIKKILEKPPVHHLRSTSQYLKQLNETSIDQCVLSVNSIEEKNSYVKSKRIRKSQSHKTKTATINKFLQDNQSYYKIEILSGKLRSSSSTSIPYKISPNKKEIGKSPPKSQQPLKSVLKKSPTKKRQNRELTLLNNEAVNFLFPPTPKYDDDSDSDESNDNDLKTLAVQKKKLIKKVKFEPESDNEETNVNVENKQTIMRENLPSLSPQPQPQPLSPQPKKQYSEEELNFELNFDHIESDLDEYLDMNSIHNEIWYQTFQRQDNFDEDLTMPTNLIQDAPLITHELRPQNPIICEERFQKLIDNLDLNDSSIVTEIEPITTVAESTAETEMATTASIIKPVKQRRKRFYKYRKMLNNPRKSPRKHASTLAILSSLNRNKSQNNSNSNNESVSDSSEKNNGHDNYDIVYNILKNQSEIKINDSLKMFNNLNNLNSIKVYDDFNVEDILEELKPTSVPISVPVTIKNVNNTNKNGAQNNNMRLLSKIRRKTNRTGWPNKRRFYARKKIEVHKHHISQTIDDNTNSELSESSNTDSNSLDLIIKTEPNTISSSEIPSSPLAPISKSEEGAINGLNEQSTTNKYLENLEKFENDITSSLKLKNLQNTNSEQPYVKIQKFNFNTYKPSRRLLRSASFTTSIVNSSISSNNGDCSYRKLRSARHCYINRTR